MKTDQPLVIEIDALARCDFKQLRPMLYRDRLSILPRRNCCRCLDAKMIGKRSRAAELFNDFWNALHLAIYA